MAPVTKNDRLWMILYLIFVAVVGILIFIFQPKGYGPPH